MFNNVFPNQNFLTMLQKNILRDRAVVDVFKAMLGAVNPIQGIVGEYSLRIKNNKQMIFCIP